MPKILIVEDDADIAAIERDYLELSGYEVTICSDGTSGLNAALTENCDLLLLDLMLDKIRGLGFGADDYIEKPFSPSVLVARVKAHLAQYHRLKPQTAAAPKLLTVGPLSADPAQHCIRKNDAELALKNKEYELLLFLMRHPGQVFSREDLYEMIWGLESMGDNITVAVHMNRLREKIEDDPSHPTLLQTVWGVGYRLNKGER